MCYIACCKAKHLDGSYSLLEYTQKFMTMRPRSKTVHFYYNYTPPDLMMASSTSTTWKYPLGTSPRKNEETVVMKELQKKLKGRKTSSDSRIKEVLAPPVSTEKESYKQIGAKTVREKQTINENMLQARARWMTHNRKKEEVDEEEISETRLSRRDFVQSCDATGKHWIHSDTRADEVDENVLPVRSFSNSYPNRNRIIPSPPSNQAPRIEGKARGQQTYPENEISMAAEIAAVNYNSKVSPDKEKQAKAKRTSAAVKKLFGFKKKKEKKTQKMSKQPIKQKVRHALSDSALMFHQATGSNSSLDDDPSRDVPLPISIPSLGYQNVFDDPSFTHNKRNRSYTNSPSDMNKTGKKPVPLPRKSIASPTMLLNDQDSDNTPTPTNNFHSHSVSPYFTSPTQRTTPNSAHSDSLMPSFRIHDPLERESVKKRSKSSPTMGLEVVNPETNFLVHKLSDFGEGEEQAQLSSNLDNVCATRKSLQKTTSQAGSNWGDLIRREKSTKRRILRKGICSDGDHYKNDGDDYIKMNSVCFNAPRSSPPFSNNTRTKDRLSASSDPQSLYYLEIVSDQSRLKQNQDCLSPENEEDEEKDSSIYIDIVRPRSLDIASHSVSPPRKMHAPIDHNALQTTAPGYNDATPEGSLVASARKTTAPGEEESMKPRQKRKIQYTPVVIEGSCKERKPSLPKKFHYQTVTMNDKENSENVFKSTVHEERMDVRDDLDSITIREKIGEPLRDSEMPLPPQSRQHPLVNFSETTATTTTPEEDETSYYVNRKSLVILESAKDLPTTMLSTVDPASGKVIWHEYVEINEDEIDKMASMMGVSKQAPIPEKLGMLLNLKNNASKPAKSMNGSIVPDQQDMPQQGKTAIRDRSKSSRFQSKLPGVDFFTTSFDTDSLSDSLSCDDEDNGSLNSSMNSEGGYIFNLNAPPKVPPRPDNLDELVNQLQKKSSVDYSYAIVPEKNLFSNHWMKLLAVKKWKELAKKNHDPFPSPPSVAATDLPTSASMAKRSLEPLHSQKVPSSKGGYQSSSTPPSIPPKTQSLLREQGLSNIRHQRDSPEPYLLPIIIKTKQKRNRSATTNIALKTKEKTSSNFISYINSTSSPPLSSSPKTASKKTTPPPKPVPYIIHHRTKGKKQTSVPPSLNFSVAQPSSPPSSSPDKTESENTPRENLKVNNHKAVKTLGGHKKLARQRSHRSRGSYRYRVQQQQQLLSGGKKRDESHAQPAALTRSGSKSRKNALDTRTVQRNGGKESLVATVIQNSHLLADKLQSSTATLAGESETVTLSCQGANAESTRNLQGILKQLDHLLKSNECTKNDLLCALESHLNIPLKRKTSHVSPSPRPNKDSKEEERSLGEDESEGDDQIQQDIRNGVVLESNPELERRIVNNKVEGNASIKTSQSTKLPYVNIEYLEDEEGGTDNGAERQQHSYINLLLPDDSGERGDEVPSDTCLPEICIDKYGNEVCPAIGQASYSSSSSAFDSCREDNWKSLESTRRKRANSSLTSPPRVPARIRSKSSIICSSSPYNPTNQPRQERTLSDPPSTEDLLTANCELVESNLDVASRLQEQIQLSPTRRLTGRGDVSTSPSSPSIVTTSDNVLVTGKNEISRRTSGYDLALRMEENRSSRSIPSPHSTTTITTRLTGVREEEDETCDGNGMQSKRSDTN